MKRRIEKTEIIFIHFSNTPTPTHPPTHTHTHTHTYIYIYILILLVEILHDVCRTTIIRKKSIYIKTYIYIYIYIYGKTARMEIECLKISFFHLKTIKIEFK